MHPKPFFLAILLQKTYVKKSGRLTKKAENVFVWGKESDADSKI